MSSSLHDGKVQLRAEITEVVLKEYKTRWFDVPRAKVKDSPEVNAQLDYLAKHDLFIQLREMVRKAQVQELNAKEWTKYGQLIKDCANMFITNAADAIICTTAQLESAWSKGIKFDQIIVADLVILPHAKCGVQPHIP